MNTDEKSKRNHTLEAVTHYITAFVVAMKGFDKVTLPGKAGTGILFLVIALFILAGTVFHHKFERALRHFKAYTYLLESIVVGIVGYLYLKEAKNGLAIAYFFASAMFAVALVVYIVKRVKKKDVRAE